jgi:TetR/AcrR family transcriptional regulator, transcriptional repressor for nem operon
MSKGDLTKDHIIARSAPIFNQRGFVGASLSELMMATGLQKGGIYRHFKSKEELAAAAFLHACRLAGKARWANIDERDNAVNQLQHFVANFIDKRRELAPGGCPVMNTAVDSDDGNPILRNLVRKALRRWTKRIEDIVSAGILKGDIRKDVDPRVTASVIIASLEGALMIARIERSDERLNDIREHLQSFLQSLAKPMTSA